MRRVRIITVLLLAALPAGVLLAQTRLPVGTNGIGSNELGLAAKKHQKRALRCPSKGGGVAIGGLETPAGG